MISRFTFLAVILFITFGCNSQKKVASLTEWKGKTLEFSSGGGFTGITTTYYLLETGQVFSKTGLTDEAAKELPCADKKKAKALFSAASKIEWPAENISQPGNMSYGLAYKTADKSHRLVWGNGNYSPPADVAQLYKDLFSIISPSKQ